ncbi:alpha/beta fold hydrolase [Chromobacterium phragmitis]|uniref:alpha/beta fold hydrolase n=1 Tax=Chromobacterium phragmitis TaxID=2202141 RepID=UPI0011AE3F95|nr:alpha/beta fold hydrolase [Chromobacterium phragmitis]
MKALRLDYAEFGAGQPLLLLLGFGMGHEDAIELGYAAAMKNRCRLICVSPRGHGTSPAPGEVSAYGLEAIVSDIAQALDGLQVEKTAVWGYSLGAKLALGLAAWHPQRVERMLLGGFETQSVFSPETDIVLEALRQGGEAWRDLWRRLMPVPAGMAERLAAADRKALQALRLAEKEWPDMGSLLGQCEMPVALYAADRCFARANMAALAEAHGLACAILPGCDHFSLLAEPARVAAAVNEQIVVLQETERKP